MVGVVRLTPREVAALRLVGDGLTEREIAARLGLSPHTVHGYLRAARRRLGAANRTAAAVALWRLEREEGRHGGIAGRGPDGHRAEDSARVV